jgi:hypothetical protein
MNYLSSLALKLVEDLEDFKDWEEVISSTASEIAVNLATLVFKFLDDELCKSKEASLRAVGSREKKIVTKFGEFKIERRLYREASGRHRFLLDEALGLEGTLSASLEKVSATLASRIPFREAADIISDLLPKGVSISHGKLHSLVKKVGEARAKQEERERISLFEEGVLPPSEGREVDRLFIEADGVGISLQKEEEKRTEVKLAVSYEGWEPRGKEFSLSQKTVHAGVEDGESFWQTFSTNLSQKYDLLSVQNFVTGGDGASWVKYPEDSFPNAIFQLSKFHILKSLKWALGNDEKKVGTAYKAAIEGSLDVLTAILSKAEEEKSGEARKRVRVAKAYLLANKDFLSDWRLRLNPRNGDRGLGAIEGNNDKILANRFKKRGMRWTKAGANRMAKVIALRENKKLDSFMLERRIEKQKAVDTLRSKL